MKYSKKEAWFSHNGTMPLFLLFIVGIFLFLRRLFLTTKIRRIIETNFRLSFCIKKVISVYIFTNRKYFSYYLHKIIKTLAYIENNV